MDMIFYNNTSPSNKVNKELTNQQTLTGTLREECSIISPVFNVVSEEPVTFNYCFIPAFKRYYYVKNIIFLRDNIYRITLSVDVLMSFKDEILTQECIVERNENNYNLYLDDTSIPSFAYQQFQTKKFPTAFSNTGSFVLVLAGSRGFDADPVTETETETTEVNENG